MWRVGCFRVCSDFGVDGGRFGFLERARGGSRDSRGILIQEFGFRRVRALSETYVRNREIIGILWGIIGLAYPEACIFFCIIIGLGSRLESSRRIVFSPQRRRDIRTIERLQYAPARRFPGISRLMDHYTFGLPKFEPAKIQPAAVQQPRTIPAG